MSFPKHFLEELKARLRVSDVVGRRVKLTRRGREYVGLSPFTNEKTPSFTVNDDKQFYHCFSTGEHGDIITFLEKTENLGFLEAVERLAGEAGLTMPERGTGDRERERRHASLLDVMSMAQDFFRDSLKRGMGAQAQAYLARRGLSAETIERFGLGYGPDMRTRLVETLQGRGIKKEQMIEAGLVIGGEEIREPYDRFRNRVIFPIEDARGRIIAYGGRALDPGARAKYLNSPETPLFHKGAVLYNYARARKPAHDAGTVIVCEGYMDVIALAQAGLEHVVAPLGTAVTEQQIELLWRLAPEPVLCFDGDKAGLRAAYRTVERVLPILRPGHSLRFALLPEGKDPDDLVRSSGKEGLDAILGDARPLIDMLWEKEVSAGQWDTPERRAQLDLVLDRAAGAVRESSVRSYYLQALRERRNRMFGGSWAGRSGAARSSRSRGKDRSFQPVDVTPKLKQTRLVRGVSPAVRKREALLVAVMLNHPGLFERYTEDFVSAEFADPEFARLRDHMVQLAAQEATGRAELIRALSARGCEQGVRRVFDEAGLQEEIFAREEARTCEAEEGLLHLLQLHRNFTVLQAELIAAERALAEDMSEVNLARLSAVKAEIDQVCSA